jgi:lipopolysaccharide export system permease protein
MKIFFRYLFMRLLQPFFICLAACTIIWIMADLYGNIDDFLEHKVNVTLILRFYLWQIPKMLVVVLPATLLFSTLFTLLSLNRRSEMIAFQSGGMAPIWMFSPFIVFAFICMLGLAYDLSGPAAQAEVIRERLLKQVKGQSAHRNEFTTLPYVDNVNRLVWYFQSLEANEGKAKGVLILQRDADKHDMAIYSANEAEWNGEFWRLSGGVKTIVYGVNGATQEQKDYQELDLPDITTPPGQLSLIISEPEQLTIGQLSQYIESSTATQEHLAKYRTEWWYRVLYPFSLIILMLFALLQGSHSDRRGAMAGVFWVIVVFLSFTMVMYFFMSMGRFNRLPPFVSVITTEVIFGVIGLHLLAMNNGWWWQLRELWKHWRAESIEDAKEDAAG